MHYDSFVGLSAVVTGAGQGIGFEICRHLTRYGARVVLNDSDGNLAKEAADRISKEGGICRACGGDASQPEMVEQMVEDAVRWFGSLDIAIANAGITLFGPFLTYPLESLRRVLEVNLQGSFLLAQKAALKMKENTGGGSILLTSSVTGHQAHENLAAYGMTKAALEMLAKNLVIELSPYRININCVAPGATLTERTKGDPAYHKTWSRITPMGRPATTEDIAHAALFLVSPEARHVTGQSLVVDGGWTSVSPSPY